MKKRILCLILSLLILPTALLFTACKEESYNLKNLNADYAAIAQNYNAVSIDKNMLKIDYSQFKLSNGTEYVNEAFKLEPYSLINNYNNILSNMLQIVADKIYSCSIETDAIDAQTKNDVKQKLDNLNAVLNNVNVEINSFANQIRSAQEIESADERNTALCKPNSNYLIYFGFLLDAYNNLFDATYSFSMAVANIHFSLAGVESNEAFANRVFEKDQFAEFLSMLDSRLKLQKVNRSYAYFLENLKDGKFSKKVVELGAEVGQMPNYEQYATDISDVTKEIDVSQRYVDGYNQLAEFYDKAITVYNVQASLNISYESFLKSLNDINYARIVNNKNSASLYELNCLNIINNYIALIKANNVALKDLLTLL